MALCDVRSVRMIIGHGRASDARTDQSGGGGFVPRSDRTAIGNVDVFGASPHVCDNPATMTWIDDEEKQYREQSNVKKQEHEHEEESQRHRAEVIRTGGRPLLEKLVEVVERDVKNYNESFEKGSKRWAQFDRKPHGGFKLDKLQYPSASVDCSLDLDNEQIRAVYGFRQDRASRTREDVVFLQFDVDANGDVVIKNSDGVVYTVDDASRLLIRRVLFGTE